MRWTFLCILLVSHIFLLMTKDVKGGIFDERSERVAAGRAFLNYSRIKGWERYFNEGLHRLGEIVLIYDGGPIKHAWFEPEFLLVVDHFPNKTQYLFSNPSYSAVVEEIDGKYSVLNVSESASKTDNVYIEAVPFALCSSVNLTREIVPRYLRQGKLKISDYHKIGEIHKIEFGFVDGSNRDSIELVFHDHCMSLLPVEAVFHKGTADERHLKSTKFLEVEGFSIPLEVSDAQGTSVCEVFPDRQLDSKRCWLAHYNLPEPKALDITEFGRNQTSRIWLVIVGLFIVCVCLTVLRSFGKFSRRS